MNTKAIMSAVGLALGLLLSAPLCQAEDPLEHPVIKPMPRSVLNDRFSKKEDFSTVEFRIKVDGRQTKVEKSGQYWKLVYEIPGADGKPDTSISANEILENYRSATLEKGGKVYNQGSNYSVFSAPGGEAHSWAKLSASPGRYTIEIIDEEGFEAVLTFGAEEMKKSLDSEGRIAIYGITFDTGKDDLKLGAETVIAEIVKLLQFYPELKIEVQGHTDNVGSAETNLQLSDRRAETVRKFILLYGVEGSRLVSKGYGLTNPIASNDTEEGKAQNRRVELVKLN